MKKEMEKPVRLPDFEKPLSQLIEYFKFIKVIVFD